MPPVFRKQRILRIPFVPFPVEPLAREERREASPADLFDDSTFTRGDVSIVVVIVAKKALSLFFISSCEQPPHPPLPSAFHPAGRRLQKETSPFVPGSLPFAVEDAGLRRVHRSEGVAVVASGEGEEDDRG